MRRERVGMLQCGLTWLCVSLPSPVIQISFDRKVNADVMLSDLILNETCYRY